jgi:hypothetical protein
MAHFALDNFTQPPVIKEIVGTTESPCIANSFRKQYKRSQPLIGLGNINGKLII